MGNSIEREFFVIIKKICVCVCVCAEATWRSSVQLCNCVCHSAVKRVSGVQEFSSGGKADQRGGEEVESGRIRRRSTKKKREREYSFG